MRDVELQMQNVENGGVCVFDGYKTVRFLKEEDGAPRGVSEEVTYSQAEVIIRMTGEVEPIDAARLYIEYLELIRSCPRYRTEKAVNCKDKLSINNGKLKIENEKLQRGELQMKPKKIKIRILEGEKVV